MSVQIGICDDETEDIRLLSEALYEYDPFFNITVYNNGNALLTDLSEHEHLFDIIFLDIYMPGINGIETALKIRESMKKVKIIFISSSNEHYPEAYDVFAFNYIIKPLNAEKLRIILNNALDDIAEERRHKICFNYKGKTYCIFCRDILYIESKDRIIYFHMANKTILQCYEKLDNILAKMPDDFFIRCHKSFAVNAFHISEKTESYFCIDTDIINISKKYQKQSKDKYFNFLFNHMSRGIR